MAPSAWRESAIVAAGFTDIRRTRKRSNAPAADAFIASAALQQHAAITSSTTRKSMMAISALRHNSLER